MNPLSSGTSSDWTTTDWRALRNAGGRSLRRIGLGAAVIAVTRVGK
jgi:hypothetical protein